MGRSIIVRGLVALVCCLIGQSLLAQNTAPEPSAMVRGVLYRCVLASGSVEYTNVPKAGCVVVSTYVAKPKSSGAQSNDPAQLIEQGTYINRDGVVVHRPAHTVSGAVPAGASAQCQDGSYSFSLHHRGTCSHHGSVSRVLK